MAKAKTHHKDLPELQVCSLSRFSSWHWNGSDPLSDLNYILKHKTFTPQLRIMKTPHMSRYKKEKELYSLLQGNAINQQAGVAARHMAAHEKLKAT